MKFHRVTFLLVCTLALCASAPAGATNNPTWQAAKKAALPAGATGLSNGNLSVLSCPTTGNCAAGGIDQNASGNSYGLLLNEVNGVWRGPTKVTAPSNADVAYGVSVYDVACGAPQSCSAVGTYADAAQNQLSFIVNEIGGVWQRAVEVALPANAVKASQVSDLHSIACASAGNCAAVGSYTVNANPSPIQMAFVINEVAGHWGNATKTTLPTGTNFNPYAALAQVSCASAGNCAAVGSYINASNATHALVVNEVRGVWHAGTSLLLPANASSFAGATLSEISCASAGNCAAGGTYNTSAGAVEMLVDNEHNNVWSRASEIKLPATAATNPLVLLYGFAGISCASAGNCAAGGQYQDKSHDFQGLLVNEVSGHWQTATELPLPAGSVQAGKNGGVVTVSCISAGDCVAGAAYENSSGNYQALLIHETNHSWGPGTKVTLPAGSTTVGTAGGIYAVACQKTGACGAVGSYETASGAYLGFTDQTS